MPSFLWWVWLIACFTTPRLFAVEATSPDASAKARVRYKAGKALSFDKVEIDGEATRPQISVVTGDEADKDNGLLRLRENFLDRIASDFAEEAP
jgi:hypothetical protein